MLPIVLTDTAYVLPSDDDIRTDNENLDALSRSVTDAVDAQILCFGLVYFVLGCMIAYISNRRVKRWQPRFAA